MHASVRRAGRTESDRMLLMRLLLLLFVMMGRRRDDLAAALHGVGRRGAMNFEVVLTIGGSTDLIFVPLLRTAAARNDLIIGIEQECRRRLLANNLIQVEPWNDVHATLLLLIIILRHVC